MRTLYFKALLILSEDSDFTKFSLALCKALRFYLTKSLLVAVFIAGEASLSTEGGMKFDPNTS